MRSQIIFFLLLTPVAFGQTHHHGPAPETQDVDLAKLPAPEKISGIGSAHIPITAKNPRAQEWFDQGLALMHCFWDYEALRAFEQAARLDPDCALCHWGLYRALAFGGHEKQAKDELTKAKELSAKASDQEQHYIRAFAASVDKTGDEADKEFQTEMEALVEHYPDDLEAKLLLAIGVAHGYDAKTGDPKPGTLYKQAILRNLRQEYPDNAAVNHYWIHAMEVTPHPELAIQSAEILGALAPASGHMVHMPGHIFFRMGDYERARTTFLQAMKVDQDYMAKQHVPVKDDWNYVHNLSYLIADCAEEGRYEEAKEHARSLEALTDKLNIADNPFFYVIQIASTEARLAIRFGRWQEVIDHPLYLEREANPAEWIEDYRTGLIDYARGMEAVEKQDLAEAEKNADLLDATLWRASQLDVKDDEKGARDEVVKLLATASLELQGETAFAKGDFEAGQKLFDRADEREKEAGYSEPPLYTRPVLEALGAACSRTGKFDQARTVFQRDLERRPHSGWAFYGIARAWDQEGKRAEAQKAYTEFLEAWAAADADLPQIKTAKAFLESQKASAQLQSGDSGGSRR